MKNLPDPFPIRYAIHIKDHLGKDVSENVKKVLWNKLIIFLQNNPLDFNNRTVKYGRVTFAFDDIEIAQLVELNKDKEWVKDLSENLQEYLDEGRFCNSVGIAYSIGLISYSGMLEVPLFWKILTDHKNPTMERLMFLEGYIYSETNIKEINNTYKKILEGDTGWLERNKTFGRDEIFELTIPYSDLWACLDLSQNKGIIPAVINEVDIDIDNKKVLKKFRDNPEKIRFTCFKDLFSMMREEMFSVYKVANFCKCCDKALPFNNRSISYCPNTPENKDCFRKRAAIRKKKSSK